MIDIEKLSSLSAQTLAAAFRLNCAADNLLEKAINGRWPLRRSIIALMPLLAEHLGARAAMVHTLDEKLEERTFVWPAGRSWALLSATSGP